MKANFHHVYIMKVESQQIILFQGNQIPTWLHKQTKSQGDGKGQGVVSSASSELAYEQHPHLLALLGNHDMQPITKHCGLQFLFNY